MVQHSMMDKIENKEDLVFYSENDIKIAMKSLDVNFDSSLNYVKVQKAQLVDKISKINIMMIEPWVLGEQYLPI